MLQQTTVGAVAARYDAFLARFPDVATLARAREESVLAAWSGLGYYARARNLHRAAREIVARLGGRVPAEPAVLRELPGVGDYMAAAVASIAFGARVPAAEANVTRVLCRVFRVGGRPGRARERRVLALAEALLPADRPGDLTAALMDLGQRVCAPRRPRCEECPIAPGCEARRAGDPERYPRRAPRPARRDVHLAAAVARRADGRVLLMRGERRPNASREEGSPLARLWRFPSAEAERPEAARSALAEELARYGLELGPPAPLGEARHGIMNRRISVRVYAAAESGAPRPGGSSTRLRWMSARELARAAIPTLTRKIAAAAGLSD